MAAIRELQVGDSFGNYVLERKLGEGGWGEVWLARHAHLAHKAPVAIKFVLRPRPKELERFEREVAILDRLRENRHVIKADDYGQQDTIPYLVMEYAPGGGLSARIREGLSLSKIADYLTQAANGLDYAHQFNIIHRDLKPSNILFGADGTLLLADFGIAHEDSFELTESGVGMGTPEYMPPEQFSDAKHIDVRADVYSLGVIVFQMLCRRLPFGSRKEGRSLYQVMTGHVAAPVPQLNDLNPNLPRALQAVMEKVMAKEPEQRYQSAGEFAAAFQAVLTESEPTEALIMPDNFVQAQLLANTAPIPGSIPSVTTPSQPPISPIPVTPLSATPLPAFTPTITPEQTSDVTASTLSSKGKTGLIIGSIAGLGVLVVALGLILVLVLLNNSGGKKETATATIAANNDATATSSPGVTARVNSPVAVATNASPATSGTKSALTVTQFAPETAGLPVYPNLKKFDLSPELLKQYEATVNTFNSSGFSSGDARVAVYSTGEDVSKLKSFYIDELEKAGWHNLTTLLSASVAPATRDFITQLEKAGGFVLIYQKDNLVTTIFGGPSQIAKLMGFNEIAPNEFALVVNLGTLVNNSPTVAGTPNTITTAAPVNQAMPGANTSPTTAGSNTVPSYPTLALYPGLKKIEVSPAFFEQAKKIAGNTTILNKAEAYTTSGTSPEEISKIKTFYKTELEKAGWKDITFLSGAITGNKDILTQVEGLGGFGLVYNDGKNLGISFLAIPATLAQATGFGGIDANDFLIFISYATLSANNSSTASPFPTLALYPGLKKLEIAPALLEQLKKLVSSTLNNSGDLKKIEAYTISITTPEEISKIKAFYKTELDKSGWKDVTNLAVGISGNKDIQTQIEALGGVGLIYSDGKTLSIAISVLPSVIAQAAGFTGVDAKDFVVLIGYAAVGTNP